jgi:hypothetical protein
VDVVRVVDVVLVVLDVEVGRVVDVVLAVLDVDVVRVVDVVVDVVPGCVLDVVDDGGAPQRHAPHAVSSAHSTSVSHSSPASPSSRPSPQMDAGAVNRRRLVARALRVPVSIVHDGSSTLAVSRTLVRPPHAVQRARTVSAPARWATAAWAGGQPLAIETSPAPSITTASNGSAVPGTSAGSTRKRTPGQGGSAAAGAGAAAARSTSANDMAKRLASGGLSTRAGRRCANGGGAGEEGWQRAPARRREAGENCRAPDGRGIATRVEGANRRPPPAADVDARHRPTVGERYGDPFRAAPDSSPGRA